MLEQLFLTTTNPPHEVKVEIVLLLQLLNLKTFLVYELRVQLTFLLIR